jgi:hypothetical protein
MSIRSSGHRGAHYVALGIVTTALTLVMLWSGIPSTSPRTPPGERALGVAAGSPISNLNFNFQPSTASVNSQVTVNVTFSGGTPGYFLWFNSTPPGCSPSANPQSSPSDSYQIQCRPSSSGVFTAHLDVLDSASPPSKASATATLSVTSNGNNNNNNNNGNGRSNNNNGGGGNGSFSLPSGLLTFALFGGVAFLGALVAIAAGTIATAAMVSRRLRQVNETLQKLIPPSDKPKPPT